MTPEQIAESIRAELRKLEDARGSRDVKPPLLVRAARVVVVLAIVGLVVAPLALPGVVYLAYRSRSRARPPEVSA